MAVLIDLESDPDFNVKCSACEVKFHLVWERGRVDLSFCPFCGEELDTNYVT